MGFINMNFREKKVIFVKPFNMHHVKVIDWDEEDSNGKGGQVSGMSEVIRERRL